MARKKKEDAPAPGSPAWMATFSDLMNLLLCFFVLLFSMSSVDAKKFDEVAASFSQTFSVFTAGALSIGDGLLISNGVSQLNELDEYINSTGKAQEETEEQDPLADSTLEGALETVEGEMLAESEELAERVGEAISEAGMDELIEMEYTSQYVQLTLNGALLFQSGSAELNPEAEEVLTQVGIILERYSESIIEIEGHTDSVPINSAMYPSNNELSDARALAVFYFIIENTNLDPAMIKHSGRGEYCPIADNSTAEGRALNRRVEIKIYNTLSTF
ncbi:MAG: flagellar motor protein MotB [Lachnospiraceae bacterium]|nr:chemotaxis protein [Lachnospiraceae bacterium]MBQ8262087.1 flagellar motor protein MotB [Lachnospiraceae bacterium]